MEPAFTDAEHEFILTIRKAEIQVDHEGRLRLVFLLSDEYCAAALHRLIRPEKP